MNCVICGEVMEFVESEEVMKCPECEYKEKVECIKIDPYCGQLG